MDLRDARFIHVHKKGNLFHRQSLRVQGHDLPFALRQA